MMKFTKLVYVLALGILLAGAASGCRKRPGFMTNIPAGATPKIEDNSNANAITPTPPPETNGYALTDPDLRKNWPRNAEIFKAYTVHFDFDSSSVKAAEKSKVAAVAD